MIGLNYRLEETLLLGQIIRIRIKWEIPIYFHFMEFCFNYSMYLSFIRSEEFSYNQ